MDPIRNPFAPGAGSHPPELAGREDVLSNAETALHRVLKGRHDRSQMLLGLRGTGKTVLLNRIEAMAEDVGYITSFIEAPDDRTLAELLYPKMQQALRKLSRYENAKELVHSASRALRSFASAFKIAFGGVNVAVEPEPGIADSGNLEYDLTDLFIAIGNAAKAAKQGWCLLLDEVQYLSEEELSALIIALHRVGQKQLPIIFFGAGLPQLAGLSGDAKSYAERLFTYPTIGPLEQEAARLAVRGPIEDEGETISDTALDQIVLLTEGYAYFLQEWGYQSWNAAAQSPIRAYCV